MASLVCIVLGVVFAMSGNSKGIDLGIVCLIAGVYIL